MDREMTVVEMIGSTPLVRLRRLAEDLPAEVYVKLESANPGGSIKDRVARAMLDDAEERGLIEPGMSVIVEPTSGNMGISLAMIGAARGYRVVLAMPESMSAERRRLLVAYGAELVLTPSAQGMQGAIDASREILDSNPEAFSPSQFDNPSNPAVHYETTGPEIVRSLGRAPDVFVAGVGTGGTVSGVGRYMKDKDARARIVAVEPAESPLITHHLRDEVAQCGPHLIQGIGANFIPPNLDLDLLDEVATVTSTEAITTGRWLATEEGILAGISTGANVAVALRIAARPGMEGATVVTVASSVGERYLSTALWEGLA